MARGNTALRYIVANFRVQVLPLKNDKNLQISFDSGNFKLYLINGL